MIGAAFTLLGCFLSEWYDASMIYRMFFCSLPAGFCVALLTVVAVDEDFPALPRISDVLRSIAVVSIVAVTLFLPVCLVLYMGERWQLYWGMIMLPLAVVFSGTGLASMTDTELREAIAAIRTLHDPWITFSLGMFMVRLFRPAEPLVGFAAVMYVVVLIGGLGVLVWMAYRGYFRPVTDRLLWSWYGRLLSAVWGTPQKRTVSILEPMANGLGNLRTSVVFNFRCLLARI